MELPVLVSYLTVVSESEVVAVATEESVLVTFGDRWLFVVMGDKE